MNYSLFGTPPVSHDSGNGAKRSESEEGEDVKDYEVTTRSVASGDDC